MNNLKGEARLEHSAKHNEYYAYDENGFICGTLGANKEKLQEMIDRSNKYGQLMEMLEAAEKVVGHKCLGNKADRPDYVTLVPCSELWELDAALRKIRGKGE